MSDYFFEDNNGYTWWMDIDAISTMLRMWSQAKAYVDDDVISVRDSNSGLRELVFHQSQFRNAREQYHQQEIGNVSQYIYTAPERIVTRLVSCYQEIPRLEQEKRALFRRVQSHNHQLLNDRVTSRERMVTALQFTRDASSAIFMCCIPASGLGVGAAMLARLGGSIFQGVATYEDTGNAVAALATSVLAFKSSLMVLPETAGRAAQIIFTIVNTSSSLVTNSAVKMMTVAPHSSTTFTIVLRQELLNAGLGAATDRLLGAVNTQLGDQVLPVLVNVTASRTNSAIAGSLGGPIARHRLRQEQELASRRRSTSEALRQSNPSYRYMASRPSNEQGGGASPGRLIARNRLRQELASRRRSVSEALWQSTPFYRYMASGDPMDLLSQAQLHVMNLLRRGS